MSNYSSIGFADDDMTPLIWEAWTRGRPQTASDGSVVAILQDSSGAAIVAAGRDGSLNCVKPAFRPARSRPSDMLRIASVVRNAAGCPHCDVVEAETRSGIPLPVELDATELHREVMTSGGSLQVWLTVFAAELSLWADENSFRVSERTFAPRSLLPVGMFALPAAAEDEDHIPEATILLHGTIVGANRRQNALGGGEFVHLEVATADLVVDVVLDPNSMPVDVRPGAVVRVSGWMVGQVSGTTSETLAQDPSGGQTVRLRPDHSLWAADLPTKVGRWFRGHPLMASLAGGGFGWLFECADEAGRQAVLKISSPTGGGSGCTVSPGVHHPNKALYLHTGSDQPVTLGRPQTAAILRQEHELLMRAGGSLLPKALEFVELGGPRVALVMERVSGRRPQTPGDVATVLRALADAVAVGMIDYHGDLKPEHVFIDEDGTVRLVDPAPRFPDPSEVVAYTPEYNPLALVGAAADVFAAAVMAYETITKVSPFRDVRYAQAARGYRWLPSIPSVCRGRPHVPEALATFVDSILLESRNRPAWAGDIHEAARRLEDATG